MTARILFGFHAVGVRLKTAPRSVLELHVDPARRDAAHAAASSPARSRPASSWSRATTSGWRSSPATHRHQGVVASVEALALGQSLDDTLDRGRRRPPLVLVLDGVTDPHNLGACLRVADGAGAHAVVAPKDHAVGINATVAKVASGAAETVPYFMVTNLARTLERAEGARHPHRRHRRGRAALDLRPRPERPAGAGVRRRGQAACASSPRAPATSSSTCRCSGAVESLNVSVASGVCLYEAARQRLQRRHRQTRRTA